MRTPREVVAAPPGACRAPRPGQLAVGDQREPARRERACDEQQRVALDPRAGAAAQRGARALAGVPGDRARLPAAASSPRGAGAGRGRRPPGRCRSARRTRRRPARARGGTGRRQHRRRRPRPARRSGRGRARSARAARTPRRAGARRPRRRGASDQRDRRAWSPPTPAAGAAARAAAARSIQSGASTTSVLTSATASAVTAANPALAARAKPRFASSASTRTSDGVRRAARATRPSSRRRRRAPPRAAPSAPRRVQHARQPALAVVVGDHDGDVHRSRRYPLRWRGVPFTVVVVLHDSAAELARLLRCIDACLAAPPQLIVVDTGSRDDGPALAAAAWGALVIERPENPGFGAASNAGRRAGRARRHRAAQSRLRAARRGAGGAGGARARGRARCTRRGCSNADGSVQRSAHPLPGTAGALGGAPSTRRCCRAGARAPGAVPRNPSAYRRLGDRRVPGGRDGGAATARPVRPGGAPVRRGHGPLPARARRRSADRAAPRPAAPPHRRPRHAARRGAVELLARRRRAVVGATRGARALALDDLAQGLTFASRWAGHALLGGDARRPRRQLGALRAARRRMTPAPVLVVAAGRSARRGRARAARVGPGSRAPGAAGLPARRAGRRRRRGGPARGEPGRSGRCSGAAVPGARRASSPPWESTSRGWRAGTGRPWSWPRDSDRCSPPPRAPLGAARLIALAHDLPRGRAVGALLRAASARCPAVVATSGAVARAADPAGRRLGVTHVIHPGVDRGRGACRTRRRAHRAR